MVAGNDAGAVFYLYPGRRAVRAEPVAAPVAREGMMTNTPSFNKLVRFLGVVVGLALAYYGYTTVIPIEGVIGVLWTGACLVMAAVNLWSGLRGR